MSLNIPFSEDEILRLISIYSEEKRILTEKLKVVHSTLEKLNQAVEEEKNQPKIKAKRKRIKAEEKEVTEENRQTEVTEVVEKYNIPKVPVSKRGRKSKKIKNQKVKKVKELTEINWRNFVVTAIRNQNEILSAEMLADWSVKQFTLQSFDFEIISSIIKMELEKLVSEKIIIDIELDKHIFYGYSLWFDQKGKVKKEYMSTYEFLNLKKEISPTKVKEESVIIEQEEVTPENRGFKDDIIKLLEKSKHLYTPDEIFERLENVGDKEEVFRVLEEMRHDEELKWIPVPNSQENQYGLINWFKKGDGTLKVYYMPHK